MPQLIHSNNEPRWARTTDPQIKSLLLYQLSYRPATKRNYMNDRRRVKKAGAAGEAKAEGRRMKDGRKPPALSGGFLPSPRLVSYCPVSSRGSCLSTRGRVGAFESSSAVRKTVRAIFSIFW